MNVQETVAAMIFAWPKLYESRADVLKYIFISSYWDWVDGQLVSNNFSEINRGDTPRFQCIRYDFDIPETLRLSLSNAMEQLRMDNAELLAQDINSELTFKCMYISRDNFRTMPSDVQKDWKQAADEIALLIYSITKNTNLGIHEHTAHRNIFKYLLARGMIGKDELGVKERIAVLETELDCLRRSL